MKSFIIKFTRKVRNLLIFAFLLALTIESGFILAYKLSLWYYLAVLPFIIPFIICTRGISCKYYLSQGELKTCWLGLFPGATVKWKDFTDGSIKKENGDDTYILSYNNCSRKRHLKFLKKEKGLDFIEFDDFLASVKEKTGIKFSSVNDNN